MSFSMAEVDMDTEFDKVVECEWAGFESPSQSWFRLFCPIHGTSPSARQDAIRQSTALQLRWHEKEPNGRWFKVVDEAGTIAAICLWKVYETNPFDQEEPFEAIWYPEGETREYATKALEMFGAPRHRMANRPHVFLNILCTHPDFRGKGASSLAMAWGTKKADELGVEAWIDASYYGIPVYEKYGFTVVQETQIRPTKANPGPAWKQIDQELQPMTVWQMWRPPFGDYQGGKVTKPWEAAYGSS